MPTNALSKNFFLPVTRQHVNEGYRWGQAAGTDYWLNMNSGFDQFAGASTATTDELAEAGWTATSLVNTAGAAADFRGGVFTPVPAGGGPAAGARGINGTFVDMTAPNHVLTNATGDLLASPAMFGDAAHMWQAARIAGMSKMPDLLIAEFPAAFTVASADETQSAIGFFEDGATVSVEADQYAVIRSNGTNFLGQGNASTMVTGPVIATTWGFWKIVLQFNGATGPNCYFYRNGTIFSATAGVGQQDEFPLKFGLHTLTTNRIGMGALHIYYDWS